MRGQVRQPFTGTDTQRTDRIDAHASQLGQIAHAEQRGGALEAQLQVDEQIGAAAQHGQAFAGSIERRQRLVEAGRAVIFKRWQLHPGSLTSKNCTARKMPVLMAFVRLRFSKRVYLMRASALD